MAILFNTFTVYFNIFPISLRIIMIIYLNKKLVVLQPGFFKYNINNSKFVIRKYTLPGYLFILTL